ncbi:unnamed protein product [Protopolystoma xenopodis]|uniref:Uncharacterized protein n=1 Tax=Protopolystoma xenopodis TaxID=117903 RepID=A0A3S5CS22_9PLAT|nr:unnamed protein product [Protopolystoma xenopodis]
MDIFFNGVRTGGHSENKKARIATNGSVGTKRLHNEGEGVKIWCCPSSRRHQIQVSACRPETQEVGG